MDFCLLQLFAGSQASLASWRPSTRVYGVPMVRPYLLKQLEIVSNRPNSDLHNIYCFVPNSSISWTLGSTFVPPNANSGALGNLASVALTKGCVVHHMPQDDHPLCHLNAILTCSDFGGTMGSHKDRQALALRIHPMPISAIQHASNTSEMLMPATSIQCQSFEGQLICSFIVVVAKCCSGHEIP